ncbi:protein kinase [Synechocystis sp. PCC 7339]|uniref:serine/threonine-protein kinase SpkC n=1 Tax=Synechocystis sp. PCC 7339 TaxID=2782213 RepID=UPI001CBDA899|nr:serine/threonine-protein kinase [Synechocystis sp. PCC 7339]UAJ72676.1 protein kinase [Synechocystis sp. PCC 7339]
MVTPLKLLNNRYRIIETLGRGGFGETFLARDTHMPSARKCVIKHLKPVLENPEIPSWLRDRFHREAAILEELGENHGQIPQLYAYFSEGEDFYLVQEWIPGLTLTQAHVQRGNFSSTAVEELLLGILPVLQFIHQRRIIHRDIKPDNIILRETDGKPILIDFGIIKETMGTLVNPDGRSAYSVALGTPGYMASEQAAGRPVFSSDLYSLGLTAIFLLTGKTPQYLTSDSRTGEILWRQGAPQVSPTLAKVIDQAVRYHPRERFSSATAMAQALQGNFSTVPMTKGDRQGNTVANGKAKPSHQPTAPTLVVGTPYNANDTQATKVYSQEFTGYTETQEGSPLMKWVVMPLVVLLVIGGGMAAGFWVTSQRRNNPPPAVEEPTEETPIPLPSLEPRPNLFETPSPIPTPATPSPEPTPSLTPEPTPTPTEDKLTPMEPEPSLDNPAPIPEPKPSPSPTISPQPSPTISIPVTPAPTPKPSPSPTPKPTTPPQIAPTPQPGNTVPVIPPPENPSTGTQPNLPAPPAAEKPIDPEQN